jgi:hypothetical protein
VAQSGQLCLDDVGRHMQPERTPRLLGVHQSRMTKHSCLYDNTLVRAIGNGACSAAPSTNQQTHAPAALYSSTASLPHHSAQFTSLISCCSATLSQLRICTQHHLLQLAHGTWLTHLNPKLSTNRYKTHSLLLQPHLPPAILLRRTAPSLPELRSC